MIEKLTDEAFLKPALVILTLVFLLLMLKRINKVLLIVGIVVLAALYLLNNRPDWLEAFWKNFQI
jgi:hypothetical protein